MTSSDMFFIDHSIIRAKNLHQRTSYPTQAQNAVQQCHCTCKPRRQQIHLPKNLWKRNLCLLTDFHSMLTSKIFSSNYSDLNLYESGSDLIGFGVLAFLVKQISSLVLMVNTLDKCSRCRLQIAKQLQANRSLLSHFLLILPERHPVLFNL